MIVGEKELLNCLENMSRLDLRDGMNKSVALVQAKAKAGVKVHTGELRQSILTSVEDSGDSVIGTCFTNLSYAPYVEFGTGPVGQENHEGISPDVTWAYGQTGWRIPGDAMDREYAESKGLGVVEGKNGEVLCYLTNGQPARPFMYPALKNSEDEIVEILAGAARRQL